MKLTRWFGTTLTVAAVLGLGGMLSGCDESETENAVEETGNAAQEAGQEIEEAARGAKQGMEDASDDMENASENGGN